MERLKTSAREALRLLQLQKVQWLLVALGLLLRLIAYLHNRSLWRDEALLASNIEGRSFAGLLQPLDNQQAAPVGFLMLERLVVQIFGNSEYALRLVPLVAGLAAVFLFRSLANRCVTGIAVPIALGLFAISDKAVYYASEVKQYSTDVAIGLALFLVAIALRPKRLEWAHAALFGLAGGLAIWFSHPSVFILAGAGTTMFLFYWRMREWSNARLLVLAVAFWVLSFAVSYTVILRETGQSSFLLSFWEAYGGFMPAPASIWSQAGWFISAVFGAFENPAGFHWTLLAGLAFLLGCASALYYRRSNLLLLVAPIPFVLLASALRKYPFVDRLILFLVPSLLLLIAEGISLLGRRSVLSGLAVTAALMVHPIVDAAQSVGGDQRREDIKPALAHVRSGWQEGDILYVHYAVKRLFKYYAPKYGFTEDDYFKGAKKPDESNEFMQDLDQMRGRVWVLFLIRNERTAQEREAFVDQAARIGAKIESFEATGVSIFLYDFSEKRSVER